MKLRVSMSRLLATLALLIARSPTSTAMTATGSAILTPSPTAPLPDCDPGGLRVVLAPGNILLLGEIHGGVEGPALIGAAVCAAVARGLSVTVALEIPRREGERVERFLGSSGNERDRAALLAGPFWQRNFQDGRSSVAMLALLDRLRLMHSQGDRVRVVPFDPEGDGQARDDGMGELLVETVSSGPSTDLLLAYAGNIHTRTAPGLPWDAAYRPAGTSVEQRWPERTVSLLLTAPPGQTWMCPTADPASCGATSLGGKPSSDPGSIELYAATREGYEGEVRLSASTASPPAARATRTAAHPPT